MTDTLQDIHPTHPRPEDAHLSRVRHGIGPAIASWLRQLGAGHTFHAADLRAHVAATCGETAPASADRILRALRRDGVVAYEVLSRRESLYLLTWVCP